jgi:hypothetical protein
MSDTLSDCMTATLASLADWTGDRIGYQGRTFRTIYGPMVLIDGADLSGSLPGRLYQRSILKADFPAGPPPEGAKITINGVLYVRRGDVTEEPLHYVIMLAKHGK